MAQIASAQAAATAQRMIGLSVFAGGSFVNPDYQGNDKGFVIGGDVTHHFRLIDPSFEIRYTRGSGETVNESSFTAGLKAGRRIGPVKPYIDVEIGQGNITFVHPFVYSNGSVYAHDNSLIYAGGGGIDIPVSRSFSLKADAQYQAWHLGQAAGNMYPTNASIGIEYKLPFRHLPGRQ